MVCLLIVMLLDERRPTHVPTFSNQMRVTIPQLRQNRHRDVLTLIVSRKMTAAVPSQGRLSSSRRVSHRDSDVKFRSESEGLVHW